jgi:hypothetical protein
LSLSPGRNIPQKRESKKEAVQPTALKENNYDKVVKILISDGWVKSFMSEA